MSFREKSTWVMLVLIVGVYGAYFASILGLFGDAPILATVAYRPLMVLTVVVLVAASVVMHIVVALTTPTAEHGGDERDRLVERKGESIGGAVLGVATLFAIGLACLEVDHFWIANGLLAGLVLAEVVSRTSQIVSYRYGV
ncbi:MAG: hypothetical protein AAGA48_04390 [Myxococcota bacterium]